MKHLLSLIAFEVSALLTLALVIYWIEQYAGGMKWEYKNKSKFNYHPLLMIIAFVIVMGHSVITFRILPLAHRTKKYIHGTLNLVAAIFATVGLVAVIQFHNEFNIPNFYSLHSWLGLVTLGILYLQVNAPVQWHGSPYHNPTPLPIDLLLTSLPHNTIINPPCFRSWLDLGCSRICLRERGGKLEQPTSHGM
eukprot:sb/3471027/